jgi:beta-lactamase class A
MVFYEANPRLNEIGNELVQRTLQACAHLDFKPEDLAITLLRHNKPLDTSGSTGTVSGFSYRGSQPFYPCSVVKLFYLVAAQERLEEGFIQPDEELDRAMRDMITVSSNTATNYVIDLITETTGDTLLQDVERSRWEEKRHWVNRYLRSFDWAEFTGINVCQKLMDDQRYGRERMFAGADGRNHNALTTDATARLFYAIFTRNKPTPARSRFVIDTLARSIEPEFAKKPGAQIFGFFGAGLPRGSRLWSKAGRTDWTGDPAASYRRHDAAYIELPGGPAFTLVAFTQGKAVSLDETVLPMIARTTADLLVT